MSLFKRQRTHSFESAVDSNQSSLHSISENEEALACLRHLYQNVRDPFNTAHALPSLPAHIGNKCAEPYTLRTTLKMAVDPTQSPSSVPSIATAQFFPNLLLSGIFSGDVNVISSSANSVGGGTQSSSFITPINFGTSGSNMFSVFGIASQAELQKRFAGYRIISYALRITDDGNSQTRNGNIVVRTNPPIKKYPVTTYLPYCTLEDITNFLNLPSPTVQADGTFSVHPDVQINVDPSRVYTTSLSQSTGVDLTVIPKISGAEEYTRFTRLDEGSSLVGSSVRNTVAITISELLGTRYVFQSTVESTTDSYSFVPTSCDDVFQGSVVVPGSSSFLPCRRYVASNVLHPYVSGATHATACGANITPYLTGDLELIPCDTSAGTGIGGLLRRSGTDISYSSSGYLLLSNVAVTPNYVGALVSYESLRIYWPDVSGPVYVVASTGLSFTFSVAPVGLSVGDVVYLDLPTPKVIDDTFIEGTSIDNVSIDFKSSTDSPCALCIEIIAHVEFIPRSNTTIGGLTSTVPAVSTSMIEKTVSVKGSSFMSGGAIGTSAVGESIN